ncbi:MAG: glycosyl transferase family 1 [Alphaproteobacteria bacterium]|nr:glycosyl transferase family 1 [Alphaproteobacteria bacterium]MBV9692143.1 glycosyl transferase family 1 [Alphaproteobacteria bacterium]
MRLAYLVHDLNDPAVRRRVEMLQIAGLETSVAGFWRGSEPPSEVAGVRALALSRTYEGRFVQRAAAALRQASAAGKLADAIGRPDLLVARNLEMLAVAHAVRRASGVAVPIVYEVLDIHRLLLRKDAIGKTFRAFERFLLRTTDLLIVSSPAFLREYFARQLGEYGPPSLVVENKLLCLDQTVVPFPRVAAGPPWRIGWYGVIRCRRSMDVLRSLAERRPDLVQIEVRGRPARGVFRDIGSTIGSLAAMRYGGAYDVGDLEGLYRGVHFNWAIDYYEENANSEWLLPNRIYEGGSYDTVPLALKRTETGRWLDRLGIGVLMDDPAAELARFLETLTVERYRELRQASLSAPRSAFIADRSDCDRLALIFKGLLRTRQSAQAAAVARQAA